jgi:hypothetical protein
LASVFDFGYVEKSHSHRFSVFRVFTHGVIPGSSHTEAQGISSPGVDEAHLMGLCNHGGLQWSTMLDWTYR